MKSPDRLADKNRLEREFYDRQAERCSATFNPFDFHVRPDDETPVSYRFFFSRLENLRGKRVLDCCSGLGLMSVYAALEEGNVVGLDISDRMNDLARENARAYKVADRIRFVNMPVETMDFPDRSFDLAFGTGALHHLQLDLASKQIARTLKPGGEAVFLEPLNNFPPLVWLRSLVPVSCLESPGGGFLRFRDLKRFGRNFSRMEVQTYHLLAKVVRFAFLSRFRPALERIDGYLLKTFPLLRYVASAVIVQYFR